MRLVAYLRVSTDDKGQDPARQRIPIEERAAKDGHEIVAWVVDEGTTGGIPAMDRPKVKEAITQARAHRARGIIAENVDRWTRCGWRDVGASLYLLDADHDLKLLFAEISGDDSLVELLIPLMAYVANLGRERLRSMTKSGMANARRKKHDPAGCEYCLSARWCPLARQGRPPKPEPTPEEWAVYDELVGRGWGLRRVAAALTEARHRAAGRDGAQIVDAKARRRLTISEPLLRDYAAKRVGNDRLSTRVPRPCHPEPRPKGPIPTQEESESPTADAEATA